MLRQLQHPNIVGVLAAFAHADQYSIVMEYVPGGSLHTLLQREPQLPMDRVLTIGLELADALSRAHHLGIIHRDLKLENVLLAADGTPRRTDFGMARLEHDDTSLTQSGTIFGSPAYSNATRNIKWVEVFLGGCAPKPPLFVYESCRIAIAVPAGSVLLFSRHARGVQIYECNNGQWALHAPRAQLFDSDEYQRIGVHYGGIDRGLTAGPWWESTEDGSRIRGGEAKPFPSPNPDSIPLLRLKVLERQGTGVFSPVTYIHRLNTNGGVSPTGSCQTGAQRDVPYTADYYFYATP
jgi:hypothetical protein